MFDTSRFFEPSFTASLAPQGSDMLDHLTTTNNRSIFFKVHEQEERRISKTSCVTSANN